MNIASRARVVLVAAATAVALFLAGSGTAFAASVSVSNEADLRAAVSAGNDVVLAGNVTLTAELSFPGTYRGEIDGAGHTVTAGSSLSQMFNLSSGAQLSLKNVTMNGADKARHIKGENAVLSISGSTFTNGTSENDTVSNEGGSIRLVGGELKINAGSGQTAATAGQLTYFASNKTVANAAAPAHALPHGGAIFVTDGKTTIEGTTFHGNKTGKVLAVGSSRGGCGGAVYLDGANGSFTDNANVYEGNECFTAVDEGGNQGGAIFTSDVAIKSTNSTFKVGKNINTGGAIYTRSSYGSTIDNATFTIDQDNGFAISGGAVQLDVSTSMTISNSTFTQARGSVQFAGGLINVVGKTDLVIRDTAFEGQYRGGFPYWDHPGHSQWAAKFGGAICFEGTFAEDGQGKFLPASTGTATLENVSISNVGASNAGGAISVGTAMNMPSSIALNLTNTTIEETGTIREDVNTLPATELPLSEPDYNASGQPVNHTNAPNYVGGQIFMGIGSKLNINGGSYSKGATSRGGIIFNQGTAVVSGGARISEGYTNARGNDFQQRSGYGAGIYNAGALTIDDATIANNNVRVGPKSVDVDPDELSGASVYAYAPVTITPKASITEDVRVLDGQSWINLTGELVNKVGVSISETKWAPTGDFAAYAENMQIKCGYLVARGINGYEPTHGDSAKLFMMSKMPEADYAAAETDPLGVWDFLLNPSHEVVVGKRAAVTFHGNRNDANPELVSFNKQTGDDPTMEAVYHFYSDALAEAPYVDKATMAPVTGIAVPSEYPARNLHAFIGWFDRSDETNPADFTADNPFDVAAIVGPRTIETHFYAGWAPMHEVEVLKRWSADTPEDAKTDVVISVSASYDKSALPEGSANRGVLADDKGAWTEGSLDVPVTVGGSGKAFAASHVAVYDKDRQLKSLPVTYTVDEKNVPAGFTVTATESALGASSPSTEAHPKATFSVTNSPEKIDIAVTKEWSDADDRDKLRPKTVTVRLKADGVEVGSKALSADTGWKAAFEGVFKYNHGRQVSYELVEDAVKGYETAVSGNAADGFKVVNTHEPKQPGPVDPVDPIDSKPVDPVDPVDPKPVDPIDPKDPVSPVQPNPSDPSGGEKAANGSVTVAPKSAARSVMPMTGDGLAVGGIVAVSCAALIALIATRKKAK
ncbi:MAG: Cna B-type domain-containing protein [Berryella intestinalis]|uniref:Cna B-type domain-containing protein n=1 Tax=Berryella intestinalis TaxID=1531429 RepID=UPI002A762C2B|nr:Cna B-type domain-containing protein [Berryella intestinalis]MDY3128419.1 Cna B-type domain-containing protein [Berryella intestinalis]